MEDGQNLDHHRGTLRYMGSGMYTRCGSELERAYPTRGEKIRKVEAYKPKGEVATSREAVRGAHSTDEREFYTKLY